jgi:hypothetical protein
MRGFTMTIQRFFLCAVLSFAVALATFSNVAAEGTVYTASSFTADCTNPTHRELAPNETTARALTSVEIANVTYFIDSDVSNLPPPADYQPLFAAVMQGGCQPTVIDLTQFSAGTQYYKIAVTYDTAGQVSAYSATVPFTLRLMPPLPPVITE